MNFLIKNAKGSIWYALGKIMFALSWMLMLAMVSRTSDVQVTGEFALAYTIASLLYFVGLFGVNHYQMLDYQKKYNFGSYFYAKLLSSGLMLLFCAVLLLILPHTFERKMYMMLLTVYMMVNSFSELYQSLFFRENNFARCGQSMFFRTLISVVVFAVLTYSTNNIAISIAGIVFANLAATFVLSVLPSKNLVSANDYLDSKGTFSVLRESFPICVTMFFSSFLLNCSKYVIDYLGDSTMQGFYSIVFVPVQAINLLSYIVFLPALNQYARYIEKGQKREFYRMIVSHSSIIAAITVTSVIVSYFFGADLLRIVFNVELTQYVAEIVITVIGGGFFALSTLLYCLIIVLHEQKKMSFCYIIFSVFSIIISLAAINFIGITGAAVSFMLAHLLLCIALAILILRCVRSNMQKVPMKTE